MNIYINDLSKYYKNKKALDHITLHLSSGIYGLIGPNGAGKTTFLSPHSSPKKRKPEDRFEIRLINKSIGRKVLYISHLEESWEEASTSTSIPFTKRDCPATTTCELSGTPDFNSYSVPMRLPSSTLL